MNSVIAKMLMAVCLATFVSGCHGKKASDETQKVQQVKIQDVGGDQTDVFAIPLDTSEEEEDLQMKKLETIEKKNEAKKAVKNLGKEAKKAPNGEKAEATKKAPATK